MSISNNTAKLQSLMDTINNLPAAENLDSELAVQNNLIAQITTALEGKTAATIETCTLSTGASHSESTKITATIYKDGEITSEIFDVGTTANTLISDCIVKNSFINMMYYTTSTNLELIHSSSGVGYNSKILGDATFDCFPCFVYNTSILLANGETKPVQDITYSDKLLVWDFDNGCYTTAYPLWIKKTQTSSYYYRCEFANGIVLKLVGSDGKCHRIFNVDDNRFESATDCVGKRVMTTNGITTLLSCERVDEVVKFYNIITERHINLFAEDVLTSCRLNNLYPIKDMKFIKENRETIPVEAYDNISVNYYENLRLAEHNLDEIDMINAYVERLTSLALPNNKKEN